MLILIAPDSFKGTASAASAAHGIAAGVSATLPDANVVVLPFADGGEGTAQALANAAALKGQQISTVTLPVTDAVGRLATASYFLNTAAKTAYIDVAAASGLPAVSDALDPLHADTYGTGVLIADAQSKGANHIILGLGGSASTDGGTGILAALGANAHDARGYALKKGGAPLVHLDSFDTAALNVKAAMLDFTLLCDTSVTPERSTAMYGPQKGASPEQVALLTGAMLRLCEVTELDPGTKHYGAAGCIPVGIRFISQLLWQDQSHVQVLAGADFVATELGLPELLEKADLIITGEGRIDEQSLTGKAVGTIAQLAQQHSVPLGLVAGTVETAEFKQRFQALEATLSQEGTMAQQLSAAGAEIAAKFLEN